MSMNNSDITIQCSNLNCHTQNPLQNQYCQKCGKPVFKRYLWAIGDWIKSYSVGELFEKRYYLKYPRILLDTKPSFSPQGPEHFPPEILLYLQLFPYRLHLPQIGGYIPSPDKDSNLDIWLLEYGSVPTDKLGELKYPNLFPELETLWPNSHPLQQLSWLRQIASLWKPLQRRGVVTSLLHKPLLRINGGVVQLLELQSDAGYSHHISELGETWSTMALEADPKIRDFLEHICQSLQAEKFEQPEQIITLLDHGIAQCQHWYRKKYHIYTATDIGPQREHNEDACYPSPEKKVRVNSDNYSLVIVCDGVGGQEGGEVASRLGIESIAKEESRLGSNTNISLIEQLRKIIDQANSAIIERNNLENRERLERMGTTLVMSLLHNQELYVAHVGDSRAYRISKESCHQLMVDDDQASREVRLGYLLHGDAVKYANAGALIQALGITDTHSLHPTVQKLIIDQDCVYLLCTDGLSDRDRVEQYWRNSITPLLRGKKDIAAVGKRLIKIANQENGHDNVTVALIHCRILLKDDAELMPLTYDELAADVLAPPSHEPIAPTLPSLSSTDEVTNLRRSPPDQKMRLFFILLGVLGIGGIGLWVWSMTRSSKLEPELPTDLPTPNTSPAITPTITPSVSPNLLLNTGDYFMVDKPFPLERLPQKETFTDMTLGDIPAGSIIQLRQKSPDAVWLKIQVCRIPPESSQENSSSEGNKPISAGDEGWIQQQKFLKTDISPIQGTASSADACGNLKDDVEDPS